MKYIINYSQLEHFIRRRFSIEDLNKLIEDVTELIEYNGDIESSVYDAVREFIKEGKFSDIDEFGFEQDYWDSYLKYEKPLVEFIKHTLKLD
jgi:hypothetical protein